jgi:hypothetical protein
MQNEIELSKDLGTARDVIVMQSAFLKEQASRIDRLEKDLAEGTSGSQNLLAAIRTPRVEGIFAACFTRPDLQHVICFYAQSRICRKYSGYS